MTPPTLIDAARALTRRLREMHGNALYLSVWKAAWDAGIDYRKGGPTYNVELCSLEDALAVALAPAVSGNGSPIPAPTPCEDAVAASPVAPPDGTAPIVTSPIRRRTTRSRRRPARRASPRMPQLAVPQPPPSTPAPPPLTGDPL